MHPHDKTNNQTARRSRGFMNLVMRHACAWLLMVTSAAVHAQTVAIVTDFLGKITAQKPLSLLSEISANSQLQLPPSATLVVIYLESGDEFTFVGPAQIDFQASAPRVLKGAEPKKKSSVLGK